MKKRTSKGILFLTAAMVLVIAGSARFHADTGTCGGQMITLPFTDVPASNIFFCSIAEAFFLGLTNGTTPTTYSPSANVPREQMAAFVTRTLDQSLKRGSRRAALDQYWTPASAKNLGSTAVGTNPRLVKSDGADLWVANLDGTVSRVRASDGKLIDTWTATGGAFGVLAAKGFIFVTGSMNPGKLYQIDPTQAAGPATTLTSSLGISPLGISFDGERVWTANQGDAPGSGGISIVSFNPFTVTTVTTGFTQPIGIIYDGANMWVTDEGTVPGKLFKLDSAGNIILTVNMVTVPLLPVFDGTNIWVPNAGDSDSVMVIRASTGAVLATLSGNGLLNPRQAAFDGERILVTNAIGSVSLWKASDLTPLGSLSFTNNTINMYGACSDGLNFWITTSPVTSGPGHLVRF